MELYNHVDLITENPKAHGVFDTLTETTRRVPCTVRSVSQSEVYQAQAVGLNPEWRICLSHSFEYKDEKICVFNGHRCRIIRTYVNEHNGIELTIQRVDGNAVEVSV